MKTIHLPASCTAFFLALGFTITPPQTLAATLQTSPITWSSTSAHHAFGLPDIKPNQKGTLSLTADTLTFTGKSASTSIPRSEVTAVSAGNQRVEIWGLGGRILRGAIPDGGGIAAAGFMHHRVDMFTVEFTDARGGHHGAVFFLPANQATQALSNFAVIPPTTPPPAPTPCDPNSLAPSGILVTAPDYDAASVPAAYRALIYERFIQRLGKLKNTGHIYREGEAAPACPQFTIQLSVSAFKEGSQVKRAVLGPIGMFVGTTQIVFDATFTDSTGKLNSTQQIKATVRGENESTTLAEGVAKSLAKHYSSVQKTFQQASLQQ